MNGGSGGSSEDDVLLSLEESFNWHNQTSGFLSSYTLPSSGGGKGGAPGDHAKAKEVLESLDSTTSSKADSDDRERDLRDIFRPPSRSPSRSPKSRICSPRGGGGSGGGTDGAVSNVIPPGRASAVCSPTERSIASDSTDAASNLTSLTTIRPFPSPSKSPSIFPSPASAATAASSRMRSPPPVARLVSGNEARDVVEISPLRGSPLEATTTALVDESAQNSCGAGEAAPKKIRKKRTSPIDDNDQKRSIRKNNLVISAGGPSPRHRQHKSLSSLPPPHPLSHAQFYPPSKVGCSPTRRHSHTSSIHSMSDASSAAESEATPVISPSRTYHNTFSVSISSAETEEYEEGERGDELCEMKRSPEPPSRGEIPRQISTSELKGIDISFTESVEDEADDKGGGEGDGGECEGGGAADEGGAPPEYEGSEHVLAVTDDLAMSSPPPSNLDALESSGDSSRESGYCGDSFFRAEHTRQFSSDDRFFEGIHDSGLKSLSFEQVVDADHNTSREAEIELVYNSGSYDTHECSSVDAESIDEQPQSDEERKFVERRLLQWRRGRVKSMMDAELGTEVVRSMEEEHKADQERLLREKANKEEEEEGQCNGAMELVPSADDLMTNDNMGGMTKNSNGSGRHSNIFGWQWMRRILFFGRYILRRHLQSSYRHGDSMGTPKRSNVSSQVGLSFNFDGQEDEDDGDLCKGLTSSSHLRQRSKRYDDVDFERNRFCCCFPCSICCGNGNYMYTDDSRPVTWQIHSGWKKLLGISFLFLFTAWVLSDGRLEKHHYYPFDYGEGQKDPLAREDFLERGRIIHDGDDYYTSHLMEGPENDDQLELLHSKRGQDRYRSEQNSSENRVDIAKKNQNFNDMVGIDTIVVLGSHHAGKDWLINRLGRLFPDIDVRGDFPVNSDALEKQDAWQQVRKHPRKHPRKLRVIDPTTHKTLSSGGYGNERENRVNLPKNGGHRKSKSAHILIVAVFINPFDWIELMRVDGKPYYASSFDEMEWGGFVEAQSLNGKTIFDLRSHEVRSAMVKSLEHDGVKLLIPIKYEDLVQPYSNYDNYVQLTKATSLPGIVGLLDQIQARTGLHPDGLAGWKTPSRRSNPFWADPIGCAGHVCFLSINKMRVNAEYIQYVNKHADWEVEQLVGYQRRSAPKPLVEQIAVLGERHSGALWLVEKLMKCFPDIPVKYGISRPGKWFQSEPDEPIPQTLVISVFLNPYSWVELMRKHPINAPAHKDMEWFEFVASPWERKRSNQDNNLQDTNTAECSYGFSFEEIVPCITQRDPQSDSFPLYELHPASYGLKPGTPYSSLLGLRADKVRNFLQGVLEFENVVDSIPVRYEDLVWDKDPGQVMSSSTLSFPGIAGLLEKIRDRARVPSKLDLDQLSDEEGFFKAEQLGVGITDLDPYYVQWMEDNVDWDVEMLVGYTA